MNMYKEYLKERLQCEFVEFPEEGFATYRLGDDFCYLQDLYVEPNKRRLGVARKIADIVTNIAKEHGCKKMLTTVDLKYDQEDRANIYAILSYGFSLKNAKEHALYFVKDL